MKKHVFFGLIIIFIGLMIAIGPQMIFPVCEKVNSGAEMNKPAATYSEMKCHRMAQAEIGAGGLIAFTGLFLSLFKDMKIRLGLSLLLLLSGLIALLLPTYLIGVCANSAMQCRILTLPALSILSITVIILSLANSFMLFKQSKGE